MYYHITNRAPSFSRISWRACTSSYMSTWRYSSVTRGLFTNGILRCGNWTIWRWQKSIVRLPTPHCADPQQQQSTQVISRHRQSDYYHHHVVWSSSSNFQGLHVFEKHYYWNQPCLFYDENAGSSSNELRSVLELVQESDDNWISLCLTLNSYLRKVGSRKQVKPKKIED